MGAHVYIPCEWLELSHQLRCQLCLEKPLGSAYPSRETFRDELVEFGRGYDLHGAGCKHREEQAKRKLGVLQDELVLLEAGQ